LPHNRSTVSGPSCKPKQQHLIEPKCFKKSEKGKLEAEAEAGREQLRRCLAHEDIARHGDFSGWLMVAVGYEVMLLEELR
jgi:hypothetical protein